MKTYIITDFGQDIQATDTETNETLIINRYGVWECQHGVAEEVVETSSDLEYLKEKYKTETVVKIGSNNSRLKRNN